MHTANLMIERRRGLRDLVDIPLALDFFPANSVRLIPMELRFSYRSALQSNKGYALHLPPTSPTVQSAKSMAVPDTGPLRDRQDLRDLADDLEGHSGPLCLRVESGATADRFRITNNE